MRLSGFRSAAARVGWLLLGAGALAPDVVFSKASPSVVVVVVGDSRGSPSMQGSGVVVGTEQVATNCHVALRGNGTPWEVLAVNHAGRWFRARLVSGDRKNDACLLKVSSLQVRAATASPNPSLKVGQRVYAIGAPAGLEMTLTEGLVSGLRRVEGIDVIQTSAAISPGSSGGGLFDEDGNLVGITTFRLGREPGLNFAFPAGPVFRLVRLAEARVAESEEARRKMRGAVQDGMTPQSGDRAEEPQFTFVEEKVNWLSTMSLRLAGTITDRTGRLELLKTVYYEANRAGIDPQVVLATIDVMSRFSKYKVSNEGARGYMQVAPMWVPLIGQPDHNLFHLRMNLRYGCTILRYFVDEEHGALDRAIVKYWYSARGIRDPVVRGTLPEKKFQAAFYQALSERWPWPPAAKQ